MTYEQRLMKLFPSTAVRWAIENNNRFPEAEPTIVKDPKYAYVYAKCVIKGRWPEAEATIAKDPQWAYNYAFDVIGGRWPEGEATIVKDPGWAWYNAIYIIGDRWPEAESLIAQSGWRDDYLDYYPSAKDDWILNGWLDWLDS